jgi:aminobenzoyl-glutamate utilization protein B
MLLAGKAIAATAIEMIENQELISQAKQELEDRLEGESYECLVPSHIHPPNYSESEQEDYSVV